MLLKKNNSKKFTLSFLVSISIHFLMILFFAHKEIVRNFENTSFNSKKRNLVPIKLGSIKTISRAQLDQIKKQIVATDQNGRKIRPEKSRFSGESDQFFDRQTIARKIGAFKEAGLGNSVINSEIAYTKENLKQKTNRESKKAKNKAVLSLSQLGTFNINQSEMAEDEKMAQELEIENNRKVAHSSNSASGIANGKEGLAGLAESNDYVEDIPLGDVTNLNTTENKYYGFYHRIRQKLEQYWGSSIHERAKSLYKNGRRIPASENLITAITVILNDKGNILDIKIEGTSGIRELDQAAVESFNKAGPFPNPPKGLLVDGRAIIQWGFVVKS